jgi:hypothetical protein
VGIKKLNRRAAIEKQVNTEKADCIPNVSARYPVKDCDKAPTPNEEKKNAPYTMPLLLVGVNFPMRELNAGWWA